MGVLVMEKQIDHCRYHVENIRFLLTSDVENYSEEVVKIFNYENFTFSEKMESLEKTRLICKRTSCLSKIVINHLVSSCEDFLPDYVVFSSRFGELDFIDRNNECNTVAEELSPTIFSHSVHNAISCLYSIVQKNKSPTNSLSQVDRIFSSSLVDAAVFLEVNESSLSSLVVCYDAYAPQRYVSLCQGFFNNYVLSFELIKSDEGLALTDIIKKFSSSESDIQDLSILNSICKV